MAKQKISEKKVLRELRRISEGIPEELLRSMMKKEIIAPTIKQLIEQAIKSGSPEITPEKLQRFQNLLDSGILDREVEVINNDTEKLISQYYDAEIALAVKMGRLPAKAELPAFIRKKGLKYARKQEKRLKELFSSEEDSKADSAEDTGNDTQPDRA